MIRLISPPSPLIDPRPAGRRMRLRTHVRKRRAEKSAGVSLPQEYGGGEETVITSQRRRGAVSARLKAGGWRRGRRRSESGPGDVRDRPPPWRSTRARG